MESFSISPAQFEKHRAEGERNLAAANDLAQRYEADETVRARIDSGNTAEFLPELGVNLPGNMEGRIVLNTADTYHFVLPPDPNVALSDETLAMVAGGKTGGTAGTVGTAGTAVFCSTSPSTVSSAASVGSVGSAS